VWLSGGRIRWRTVQIVLDNGYVDAFRVLHPTESGATMPTARPHVRLDYVFVPRAFTSRLIRCDVVRGPDAEAASDHYPVVADFDA
jgi:endonuclease/exonuclease/phosphatase family metal-dependent hydrolase